MSELATFWKKPISRSFIQAKQALSYTSLPLYFPPWIKTVVLGFMLGWTRSYEWGIARYRCRLNMPNPETCYTLQILQPLLLCFNIKDIEVLFISQCSWQTSAILDLRILAGLEGRNRSERGGQEERIHWEERRKQDNWWKLAKEQEHWNNSETICEWN